MIRTPNARRRLVTYVAALTALALTACDEAESDAAEGAEATPTASVTADPTTTTPSTGAPTTTAASTTTEAPPTTATASTAQTPTTTDAPSTTALPTTLEAAPKLVEVTAADFELRGLPTELAAGTYRFAFANAGTEPHEMVLFRNTEGLSLEELSALGPAEAPKHVELGAFLFAEPGSSAAESTVLDLTPGEYEVVCFIPTPTDGQPHFAHGMHAKITVS